jgi:hypothetical protein
MARHKRDVKKKEIYLPTVDIRELNQECEEKAISFAELVRRILSEYIQERKSEKEKRNE